MPRPSVSEWPDDEVVVTAVEDGFIAVRRMRIGRQAVELTGHKCTNKESAIADVMSARDAVADLVERAFIDRQGRARSRAFDAMKDEVIARKLSERCK